jgi:hypothetical protein
MPRKSMISRTNENREMRFSPTTARQSGPPRLDLKQSSRLLVNIRLRKALYVLTSSGESGGRSKRESGGLLKSKAGLTLLLLLCKCFLALSFPAPSAFAQTLTPATLSFGREAIAQASAPKPATFKNTQTVPLTFSGIVISGGNAAGDYALANGGTCPGSPNTLGAGKTCKIYITLKPSALGSRTATLMVSDSVSTSSIALSGTGIAQVTPSPTSLSFAGQFLGTTSTAKTVILTNHLTSVLSFSSISASGDFAVASNRCSPSIGAGLTCAIGVTFSPTAIGHRTGTLTINDSALGSPTLVLLSGTGNDTGLASITVTPTNPSVAVGSTLPFTATGNLIAGGTQNLTPFVTWKSSASGVATISSGGVAAGVAAGTSTISAKLGSITGSTVLTVTSAAPVLVSILVTPANASIPLGETLQYTATGTYNNGTTANLTNTATWNASGAATISTGGLAKGVTEGTSTISANVGTVSGTAILTVTAPVVVSIAVTPTNPSIAVGTTQQFAATATYSNGSTSGVTDVATWSSLSGGVAQIGETGIADALGLGQTTIQAAYAGIDGSTGLTVTAGFVPTGSLNTARYGQTATMLNSGLVLVVGGYDSTGNASLTAELYNPADRSFSSTGNLNTARYEHTATLLNNGTVLIAGGYSGEGYLASAELYNPATGAFSVVSGGLNTARDWDTATLLNNGMVLIAGGLNSTGFLLSAELYNPATQAFTYAGSLNTARYGHTATLLNNGAVLIAGGDSSSGELSSAELYNPATEAFSYTTGSLNTARATHTATLLNSGMVLIAGGSPGEGGTLSSAELYNPATQTFTYTASLNTARFFHTATLLNDGMVLMVGGDDSNGGTLASAELYDPVAVTFTYTGSLNIGRSQQTATLLNNGTVLVAAGSPTNLEPTANAELYEPATLTPVNLVSITVAPATPTLSPGTTQQFIATGTFSDGSIEQLASVTWSSSSTAVAQISNDATNPGTALAIAAGTATITATDGTISGSATLTVRSAGFVLTGSLNTARYGHTATLLNNGMVLIAGGESASGYLASAELYNPATGTFTATGSMNTARVLHTATLLNNGTVLIVGGGNSSNAYLASAELYNPATGTFTYTAESLNPGRYGHTATLLNDGTVLIAGGAASCSSPGTCATDSAEIYDPATGNFSYTGNLNAARWAHTATLLDNGMVLIAGGTIGNGPYLSSAELYDPTAGTFSYTGSLNTNTEQATATLLESGIALIAGGEIGCNGFETCPTAIGEEYNATEGTFANTGSLNTARYDHTSTLLIDGEVLITGGASSSGALASAELFSSTAGTFSLTGSMNAARGEHTATLLDSGMVLIVGGYGSSGAALASAELY